MEGILPEGRDVILPVAGGGVYRGVGTGGAGQGAGAQTASKDDTTPRPPLLSLWARSLVPDPVQVRGKFLDVLDQIRQKGGLPIIFRPTAVLCGQSAKPSWLQRGLNMPCPNLKQHSIGGAEVPLAFVTGRDQSRNACGPTGTYATLQY